MVRFARTGGEASSIAVRIARAVSSREKVAICGYHGWHDWYLSSNLNNRSSLDKHLMNDLSTSGLPKNMKNLTFSFEYNNFEQLKKISNNHKLAAIVMEVSRNEKPKNNFLKKIRDLANKKNIVLIFDECTSGFRETFGGLHKKYNVEPDIAMFGKTLGNGYAIAAVIGKSDVMQAAQSTFISSTFWTERIGPSAALKALEVMEREKSWETVTRIGESISSRWQSLANKYELDIETWGLPALSGFTFKSQNFLSYKTLITQKLLKKGYLAANSVYACTEHKKDLIDGYFAELEPIFLIIKECEEGLDINSVLEGPICHSGFKRLN
jgi:glutamate-1-semialdehyde 2,1-aminomutase